MHCRIRALRPTLLASVLASFALWTSIAGAADPAAVYPNTEGFGVPFSTNEEWYRHCMRVQGLVAPRPPAPPGKARCDAAALYYRKHDQARTSAAEWRQVRSCAEASGDDAILMMLYANGYGSARDMDRAIYHACRLDTAKAEMEARVAYLASTAAAADRHPFDLCDHITSGRMGSVCAAIGESRADRVRAARLDRFAASVPAKAREPFARLRQAAAAFARQSAAEVDLSGTGGPGFATRHAGRRDQEFMETLLNAAGGKLPRATTAQLAQLDQALNAQYQTVLGLPSENDDQPERLRYSTVTREDVRSTERAWLVYRDAWDAFAAAAPLPTDAVSIKAVLIRQRIAQLKRL